MKLKNILFILPLVLLFSCQTDLDEDPQILSEREEMLKMMDYTAKVVSRVLTSNDARNELLGHAFEENAGEVYASFNQLLSSQPIQKARINKAEIGSFAERFRPMAEVHKNGSSDEKLSSVNQLVTDLEEYLKKENLALYGPYISERHAKSAKPITISFDPLDPSKTSNYGYVLVPKRSNKSSANLEIQNNPMNLDDYEMTIIDNIDDNYTYNNPTIFVVVDDGNTNPPTIGSNSDNNGGSLGTRAIDCTQINNSAIVELVMPKFRLKGNLSGAPWERNFLDMWAISGDDIDGFDPNGKGILNQGTSKLWSPKQVSRANGRNHAWLNPDISFIESNWQRTEPELVIFISYKERSSDSKIDLNVKTVSDTTTNTTSTLTTTVEYGTKHSILGYQNFDRCSVLANFEKDRGNGTYEGLRVYSYGGKLEFTLKPYVD